MMNSDREYETVGDGEKVFWDERKGFKVLSAVDWIDEEWEDMLPAVIW